MVLLNTVLITVVTFCCTIVSYMPPSCPDQCCERRMYGSNVVLQVTHITVQLSCMSL